MVVEAFQRKGLWGWRIRCPDGSLSDLGPYPASFPTAEAALDHAAHTATELLASFTPPTVQAPKGYRAGYRGGY